MVAQSSFRNMVVCLTLTCLLCASILGVVYAVTLNPIRGASQKALESALSLVLPPEGEISTEALNVEFEGRNYEYYVQTVDGEPSAWAVKSEVNGFGGPLTVLVGVKRGGVVNATKVLSHSETPGLGAKCQSDEHFIGQFNGFDTCTSKLLVRKDGGDVDAITASTITSRAYTLAVSNAVEVVGVVITGTVSDREAEKIGQTASLSDTLPAEAKDQTVSVSNTVPAEAKGLATNNDGGQDNE